MLYILYVIISSFVNSNNYVLATRILKICVVWYRAPAAEAVRVSLLSFSLFCLRFYFSRGIVVAVVVFQPRSTRATTTTISHWNQECGRQYVNTAQSNEIILCSVFGAARCLVACKEIYWTLSRHCIAFKLLLNYSEISGTLFRRYTYALACININTSICVE